MTIASTSQNALISPLSLSLTHTHPLSQSLTVLLTHSTGADDNRLDVAERADAVRRCLGASTHSALSC